jgi:hypothetical protein
MAVISNHDIGKRLDNIYQHLETGAKGLSQSNAEARRGPFLPLLSSVKLGTSWPAVATVKVHFPI